MGEEEGGVVISRSERLRIPRVLDSARVAKLKTFRTKISDFAAPSLTVYDEPIIVAVKEKRTKTVDGKMEWWDEKVFDHFHVDVVRFEELISRKKLAGYAVSAKDAVLAYMLVWKRGQKSVITGFLNAFSEWKSVSVATVGQAMSRLAAEGVVSPGVKEGETEFTWWESLSRPTWEARERKKREKG